MAQVVSPSAVGGAVPPFIRPGSLPINVLIINANEQGIMPGYDVSRALQNLLWTVRDIPGIGGVVIYFSPGVYYFGPEIDIPLGIAWKFIGAGSGWTNFTGGTVERQYITMFRRHPAIYTDPTAQMFHGQFVGSDRVCAHFEGILMMGGGGNGITDGDSLIAINGGNQCVLRDMVFLDYKSDIQGLPGVWLGNLYNSTIEDCWFHAMGSQFDPFTAGLQGKGSALAILGGSNTVKVNNVEFEGNYGTDLWIGDDGSGPSFAGTDLVTVSNFKFERGQIGQAGATPHIAIGQSQGIQFVGGNIAQFREVPAIKQINPSEFPTIFSGVTLSQAAGVSNPQYQVELTDGSMIWGDSHLSSPVGDEPTVAYFHLAPGAGDFRFGGTVDKPSILVDDDR